MDWTTVSRSKNRPRSIEQTTPYKNDPIRVRMTKLAEADCPGPKKCINSTSLQSLIRTRIEKKLSQEKADILCAFPRNTFKNIESNRMLPTEEQKRRIQQHFVIYLKIDTIE